jgi:hypothetical protein
MLWACGNVDHVTRAGFDGMVVEAIADPAGQDENGMAGFAPRSLSGARRVGGPFLVAQSDTEAGHGLSDLQAVAGGAQRMVGSGEQVRAGWHRWEFACGRAPCHICGISDRRWHAIGLTQAERQAQFAEGLARQA